MVKLEDKYAIDVSLGSGTYAEVFRCTSHETGEQHAVKVINKQKAGSSGLASVQNEVSILRDIQHPNCIAVIEAIEAHSSLYIVLELVLGGELFDKIVELKHYSEMLAAKLVRNIVSTLQYLHNHGICHRDLKPENLLLKHIKTGPLNGEEDLLTSIKLVDFGFAVRFSPGENEMTECCGTPNFIAPEILNHGYFKTRKQGYNEKCDLWSTGVLAYILLCGYPPFHANSRPQMFRKIAEGRVTFHSGTVWDMISADAKDFISNLLLVDEKRRWSADAALDHRWLKDTRRHSDLGLKDTQRDLVAYAARRKVRGGIIGIEAAHRLLYLLKCKEGQIKPNSAYLAQLDVSPDRDEDLTTIDLTNNYLGVKGLRAALAAIQTSDTVTTLNLRNNQIDNAGVTVLVECIKNHPTVTELDLSSNPITQLAGRQLLNLVQDNRLLVTMRLEDTMVKDVLLKKINAQLERNAAAPKGTCCIA